RIKHIQGISVYKDRSGMIKIWNADCLKYFKKHNFNFFLYPMLSIGLKVTGIMRVIRAKILKV
ncbi:MAG: hypothetical protein LWX07_12435, partial [Bacteroidetes bacterium]|nr:hypothetical protein [Bacteroidota bacterium]